MPDLQNLKRVDLSDLHQPAQIANRIHRALSQVEGPVPAVRIARALDISQVRLDKFDGFEGMLLTDRRRSDASSSPTPAAGIGGHVSRSRTNWVIS